jgi:hypothetical protein
VHPLARAITDWLTKQHLEPDALAAVIPAARRVSSTQQHQVQQQLECWLLPQAAKNISAVCDTEQFKSSWTEDDVRVLLAASSGSVKAATIEAVRSWVAHDEEARAQHWPALLDCLDFNSMSAADMAAVAKEMPGDAALTGRMFEALLARQMDVEEALQGGS